jgi:hypothetical protein
MLQKPTKTVKKSTVVIFALFLLLLMIYKPFEQGIYGDTAIKRFFAIFSLYSTAP